MSEQHLRLLTTLCQQLSIAIEKSRLYDSLERKIRELERHLDTLEKTNILKSDFVSHVSHELRTPLTAIKAYVEALVDNSEDPKFLQRKEFLDIVSKETNRLIRIVNDVLDVSKIEFGQRPMARTPVDLPAVVADVRDTLRLVPLLDGADAIVHTASLHVPDLAARGPEEFRAVNVEATGRLLQAAQTYESLQGAAQNLQDFLRDFQENPGKFLRVDLDLF